MTPDNQGMSVTSPDFFHDGAMEDRHAQDGANDPPRLEIGGVPPEAVQLAVICHDPDAPRPWGFTHWMLYGIPADTRTVGPGSDDRFQPGTNDFGSAGYGGPRPPAGHGRHHYYFWVYALDSQVAGVPSRCQFLDSYGASVIEQNRLVGVYER